MELKEKYVNTSKKMGMRGLLGEGMSWNRLEQSENCDLREI
jgi:hypothetical protein